ncbi:apoptosis-antagonizing transcription factor [Chytridium lagenaria]|nr:apoptosis-antagonizing transcription factor [Chytridium lagenaria]
MSEDEEEDDEDVKSRASSKKTKKHATPASASVDLTHPLKAWNEINAFDKAFRPFRDATIEKWSAKVSAATAGANLVSSAKKFKAINTSVLHQINTVLADRERLVKRTQLLRDGGAQKAIGVLPKPAAAGGKMDAQLAQYDVEIFDDGDFYQQLLKELVEARMGTLVYDPLVLGMKFAELKKLQNKKKKKQLRYHVHEKIQNFMAPEPRGTWHEEMVDELFMSLFEDVAPKQVVEEVSVPSDGLRLFG